MGEKSQPCGIPPLAGRQSRIPQGQEAEIDTVAEAPKGLADWASIAAPARCIYCQSENIVKRGKRKKKLEEVQLYLCNDCGRAFTGQTIKGKMNFQTPISNNQ